MQISFFVIQEISTSTKSQKRQPLSSSSFSSVSFSSDTPAYLNIVNVIFISSFKILKWKIINICFVLILIDTTTFCNHHVSLLSYQMTGKFSSRDIAAIFSDISNKHPVVECPLQICLTMSPQLTEYRVNIFSMLSLL